MNGIGGRTILEAQHNMTLSEYGRWLQFRKQFGPLNSIKRLDEVVAQLGTILSALAARKKILQPHDFAPWLRDRDDEELTLEEAFQTLTGVARSNEENN